MGFYHGPWGMGGWGLFGGMFVLFFFVGLLAASIGLVAWLWRRSDTAPKTPESQQSAQEILRIRYARGELIREEFKSAMEDLSRSEQ